MSDFGLLAPADELLSDCGFRNRKEHLSRLCVGGFLVLTVLVCSGCGPGSDGVPVEGTVSYNGQPLGKASVTFYPATGRPQSGIITDGQYALQLQPGEYKVTIGISVEVPEGYKEGDPLPPPKLVLPKHYTIRTRTQLSATVAEDQAEPINFDLN